MLSYVVLFSVFKLANNVINLYRSKFRRLHKHQLIRASLTRMGRATTRESRPGNSVGAWWVTAWAGPGAAVASLGRSRGPARPRVICYGTGRKSPNFFFFFWFFFFCLFIPISSTFFHQFLHFYPLNYFNMCGCHGVV